VLHAESPLKIPLVRQMLGDGTVALRPRAVDSRWRDRGRMMRVAPGFNPFVGAVFIPRSGGLEQWLAAPQRSARRFNADDRMFYDLLFAVHDYLHVWSTRLIQCLAPELGFGTAPVTRDNFDDYVFCQMLSEAAATVGLDYWYLSTVELDEVVPIGSTIRMG
jgi:hypothetical protein